MASVYVVPDSNLKILFRLTFSGADCPRGLYRWLPLFRSPQMIVKNRRFLVNDPSKEVVLDMLANGLRGDWGTLPPPGLRARNFLKTPTAVAKCRDRFEKEVTFGRMIGGPGWTPAVVANFLSSSFYTIPCGAVPKGDDPLGRIIHNYSHKFAGRSINDSLVDNSVHYISFKERVALLQHVK